MQEQETVIRLAKLLYDKKAQDIVVLKVYHLTVQCDSVLIASGRTASQLITWLSGEAGIKNIE